MKNYSRKNNRSRKSKRSKRNMRVQNTKRTKRNLRRNSKRTKRNLRRNSQRTKRTKFLDGVDYAPKVIGRVKKLKPHLKIELGNVFDLNFPDEYFGTYYSWGVVEHFEDGPEPIIKEAFRVLKKGGKLLISVPFWNKKRANHFGEVTSIGKGEFYQYLFSEKEFRTILEQSGFRFHKSYKLNWIKCYRQLKRSNSKLKKKTISNSEESKPKKFLKDPFWKRTIKRIIIKIEDFSALTSNMGHMILFVVEKK